MWLRDNLAPDDIITNGAGNFVGWIHRFYRFRKYATHVAPTSGSMGYGFPAAVAMKLMHPERTVVCVAGDGDFLMTGQDFATAVQYKLPVIVVVAEAIVSAICVMSRISKSSSPPIGILRTSRRMFSTRGNSSVVGVLSSAET